MLDEKQIVAELLAMHEEIVSRDGRQPWFSPTLNIESSGECRVSAYVGPYSDHSHLVICSADTVHDAIANAWPVIRALPTQEDAKRDRFAKALGAAIEAGSDAGIDLEFINPLREAMKRLSENAITKAVA